MHLSRPTPHFGRVAAVGAIALLVGATGCDEIQSRREIQRGNRLYIEGQYRKAVQLYDTALGRTPHLAVGHHNAGLAYFKLFQPGLETGENRAVAEKAAAHFQTYLESEGDDLKIVGLLTNIWLDSGQYDKALAYWSGVLAKDPNSIDVIEKLANINRQAGKYGKALEWHYKRVALEKDRVGKVKAYLDAAQVQWSRLQKPDLVDAERAAVVDVGLAALQRAQELDPNHALVQSLMGSLYQHRALAHQASWAKAVESASQRFHQVRFTEIQKALGPAAPKAPGAPNQSTPAKPPTPAAPK